MAKYVQPGTKDAMRTTTVSVWDINFLDADDIGRL